jgi:hypothetical protein
MKKTLFTLLLSFSLFIFPYISWGQCTVNCPNNNNACNNNPNCCVANGNVTVNACLASTGITIIRVNYDATIAPGTDITNTTFCLTSNNDLFIANNVMVDNTTCFAANGNNDVVINLGGEPYVFNAGPRLDILNAALADLTITTPIQEVVIALPVQLLSYTIKTVSEGMLLEWATAAEHNNQYFSLERSIDGKLFELIAQVSAQGDGSQTQYYQFLDREAKPGINYYRLTQNDFDGTKAHLGIVQARSNTNQVFTFAPNPVASGARISLFLPLDEASLPMTSFQLVNTLGQVWPLFLDQGSLIIPSGLSQGLYYLTVIQPSGREVAAITIIN